MKNLAFNASWWNSIKLLNVEDRKEVLYAVMALEMEGEEPDLSSENAATVWAGIAKDLLRRRQQRVSKQRACQLSSGDKTETEQSNEKDVSSPAPFNVEKEKKKEKEPLKKHPVLKLNTNDL